MLVLMFVMSYHLVLMFSWSPMGPLLCGSTIESPLFRESKWSHHHIHGVYPESLLYPAIVLHPSLLGLSLVSHIMAFSPIVPYPS